MTTRSPARIAVWSLVRLATAALIIAAVVAQFVVTLGITIDLGRDVTVVVVNFFSFFTILSNCVAAIVLAIAGVWGLSRGRSHREPRWLSILIASATTYMVVTGIVYNILLRGYELPQGSTVWWSNEVLHLVAPLLLLLDVFFAAPRRALPPRAILAIILFPIAWVIYTMVRGELVTNPTNGQGWWYPYPFLNPYITPNGYIGVAGYIVGIAVAFALVAALVVALTRRFASEPPSAVAVPAESASAAPAGTASPITQSEIAQSDVPATPTVATPVPPAPAPAPAPDTSPPAP